jgi:hypothetical protein
MNYNVRGGSENDLKPFIVHNTVFSLYVILQPSMLGECRNLGSLIFHRAIGQYEWYASLGLQKFLSLYSSMFLRGAMRLSKNVRLGSTYYKFSQSLQPAVGQRCSVARRYCSVALFDQSSVFAYALDRKKVKIRQLIGRPTVFCIITPVFWRGATHPAWLCSHLLLA